MYKEYADYSLEFLKKNSVDYGEVRLEEHDGEGMVLKNGSPEVAGFDQFAGMGIRFLVKNSLGFVSINEFQKEKIKKTLERALKLVNKGRKLSENVSLSEEKVNKKNYKVAQKIKLKNIGPEEKIKLLYDVDSNINKAIGRYLGLSSDITKKYLITTEGTKITSEIPRNFFT